MVPEDLIATLKEHLYGIVDFVHVSIIKRMNNVFPFNVILSPFKTPPPFQNASS